MSYTPYGEKTVTGPDIFHQKYTGQVDDGEEAELLYYNARYYDPKLGRFISADSIIPDPGFSQSFNRYMYVLGNPITFNDPTGHHESTLAHGDGHGAGNTHPGHPGYSDNGSNNGIGSGLGGLGGSSLSGIGSGLGNGGNSNPTDGNEGTHSSSNNNGHGNSIKDSVSVRNYISTYQANNEISGLTNVKIGNCHYSGGNYYNDNISVDTESLLYAAGGTTLIAIVIFAPEIAAGYNLAGQWIGSNWAVYGFGGGVAATGGKFGLNRLINAANKPYKTGQFTVAGRALTKHPNIAGVNSTVELYRQFGNQSGINNAASLAIENFVQNGNIITKLHPTWGNIIDYKFANGLGVRFSAETGEFLHFLGRGLK